MRTALCFLCTPSVKNFSFKPKTELIEKGHFREKKAKISKDLHKENDFIK